jgi:hypothetical protein
MARKLFDGDGSALQASLVRPALEGDSFESATEIGRASCRERV